MYFMGPDIVRDLRHCILKMSLGSGNSESLFSTSINHFVILRSFSTCALQIG